MSSVFQVAPPDSGACEHVGNPRGLSGLGKVKLTEAVKQGVTYGTASGHSIPNLGQLDLNVMTGDGISTDLSLQMADVTKTLLSVKRMTSAGNRVVFDHDGSFVENALRGVRLRSMRRTELTPWSCGPRPKRDTPPRIGFRR